MVPFYVIITGLQLQQWDIYSLRQPDAIKYFEVLGVGYIITANEGEGLEYSNGKDDWVEFERGEYFFESKFNETLLSRHDLVIISINIH